ncbi:MAG: alpha/beta hydrolase [Candidatus Aenigmatarchaeota archaeon]
MTEKEVIFDIDNEKIIGHLHLPETRTDSLVIIVHGFTANEIGPGNAHIKLAESLVQKNIAALRFNFRYTTPDLKEFEKTTISGEVKDLETIINKMSEMFSKIGLVGESMGAVISLMSYDNRIKTIVLWYPPLFMEETGFKRAFTDEAKIELETNGYLLQKKRNGQEYKIGKAVIEEIKKIDVAKYAKKVTSPTLILHGEIDTEVPLSHAEKLLELLKGEKKLVVIRGMEHAFKNKDLQRDLSFLPQLIDPTVDWFNRWLK